MSHNLADHVVSPNAGALPDTRPLSDGFHENVHFLQVLQRFGVRSQRVDASHDRFMLARRSDLQMLSEA